MKRFPVKLSALLLTLVLLVSLSGFHAAADGTMIVGEVTITHNRNVNLRSGGSTSYPIVGSAKPGELFQTTGQVASGWYEIILEDGSYAFVTNSLVYFNPYPNPIPLGSQYTLPVYYRTATGQNIKTINVPVRVGQNTITADDSQAQGYRLTSTRSVYVSVDAGGRANPSGVIFTYEPLVQTTPRPYANVQVQYRDSQNQLVASETRTLVQGAQLVRADALKLPSGYYLSGNSDAVVVVSYDGTVSPSVVNFVVARTVVQTPQPTSAVISISYRDETGKVLHTTSQTVSPGYTTITANDRLVPSGMTLTSTRDVTVFVSTQGVSFPSGVIFTYKAPTQANVQIVYQDQFGRNLYSEVRPYAQGTHTVTADDSRVTTGYVLQGSRSQQLTVYANGTTNPQQILFTYALPVSANIPVYYRNAQGQNLHSETLTRNPGAHTISANDSNVPAGYVLQGSRDVRVQVSTNGYANPNQVVFTYAPQVTANINIEYRDNVGTLFFSESRTFNPGTYTISANDGRAPSGYQLQGYRDILVTVYNNGAVSQNTVVFVYNTPQPLSANILVLYKDGAGNELHRENVTITQSNNTVTAKSNAVPAGYVLQGAKDVRVTINANGTASPNPVTFLYYLIDAKVTVVYKDGAGNEWHRETVALSNTSNTITANDSIMPAGYTLHSVRNVQVNVSGNGQVSPNPVEFIYHLTGGAQTPTQPTQPQQPGPGASGMLPGFQEFSYSGDPLPVYSGPGTHYYRAASGKATLGGGRVRVWGTEGDWAMIGYGLSNNLYRIGYIQKSTLPADLWVPELQFAFSSAPVVSKASLTDDPIINPTWLMEIPAGNSVTFLAHENFVDHWAYIETTYEGQPIRGFVNKIRIQP